MSLHGPIKAEVPREQRGSAREEEAGLEIFRISAGSEILLLFPNRLLLLSQKQKPHRV